MLNEHDRFDRRIRALIREDRELDAHAFTVLKLDSPIHRGWIRSHFLTRDAERRRDRELLTSILRQIGNTQHRHDSTFLRRKGRGVRKRMVEIAQPLREFHERPWRKLVWPPFWQDYFRAENRINRKGCPYVVWTFKEPHLFELRIEPNLYWYVRVPNPLVESRQAEIRKWLQWNEGDKRLANLKGISWRRKWQPNRNDEKIRIREMDRAIFRAMRGEVDSTVPAWRRRISLQRSAVSFSLS